LHVTGAKTFFPAAGGGVSRRYDAANMSIAKWLEARQLDERLDVLLVVNPTEDLDGAEEEAQKIRQLFPSSSAVRIEEVRGSEATSKRLLDLFRSGRFDVLHYAGHAMFDAASPVNSGILCAQHQMITGADLAGLSNLPALVFFNACESARIRGYKPRQKLTRLSKPKLEAHARRESKERVVTNIGLAEAFLRGGVANYIGTYWPVGDESAMQFAKTLYSEIVAGKSVGDALQSGRLAVQKLKSVDWVDYIHYGSHDFVLKRKTGG
jgi:CHAT domain-containing protein